MSIAPVGNRALLRNRQLRLLLLADVVDASGTWAFATVFSLVVFERTNSVSAITVALACRWAPALVFGTFAGVLADRYERSRLMIGSAATSLVLMGVLAAGVAAGAPLPVLLTLSGLQAVVATVYGPSFGASLPDVLPEHLLAGANGLREITSNLSVIAGPAVATLLLLSGDPALGIVFNAATYLVPIVVVARLRLRSRGAGGSGGNPFAEIRDGVSALLARRAAVVLFVAISLDSAVAGITTALALPISRYVGTGSRHYGYLLIALSLGSVLAAGVSSRLAARPRLAWVIVGSLVAQAVPFALIVAVPHAVPAFLLLAVSGAGMIVVDLVTVTALQRDIPGEYLGRIFGLLDTTLLGFVLVFTVLGGLLVSWAGLGATLLVVGIGVPVVVFAGLPVLLDLDRRSAARAAELEPRVELLRRLGLFDGADRPTLERVAAALVPVTMQAGEVLLDEGDPAEDVWLLAAGELAVTSRGTGALPPVTAPGYVGEIGVLHERPRTASVSTTRTCELFQLAATDFRTATSGNTVSPSMLLITGRRLARTEPRRPAPARRPRPYPA